jgi:3D (Asp-Asp-Asp) domain-containing protein/peptidoglycan hydrolase CwlO-like protein
MRVHDRAAVTRRQGTGSSEPVETWYGGAALAARWTSGWRLFATLAVVVATIAGSSSVGAGKSANPSLDVGRLKDREAQALLDLYAADSALARANARVASLETEVANLRTRVAAAKTASDVGRRNLAAARGTLIERLATSFRAGTPDPIAILLGARSLGDALDSISLVDRAAARDASLVQDINTGTRRAAAAAKALAGAEQRLTATLAAADAERGRLVTARAGKVALLASLRTQEQAARVAQLDAAAQKARQIGDRIGTPQGGGSAGTPPPTPTGGGGGGGGGGGSTSGRGSGGGGGGGGGRVSTDPGSTLTVLATAYAIHGNTATGIPTRRGVCATDPRVIPLGTRFTVPGYGTCVAADVGSAVIGARIDVWVATESEALQWGMRNVTITFQ